jgi:predicted secreted protein
MQREIHIHIQVKHIVVLGLILGLAFGATNAMAFTSENPVTQFMQNSYGPPGQLRIAYTAGLSPVDCGYFGACTASAVSFNVPVNNKADLVVLFTGNADTTGTCHVIPLLDGKDAFLIDPQIFASHTSTGKGGTEHWTLDKVRAGKHTVSIVFSEVENTTGQCTIYQRYLTVLVNVHAP